MLQPEISFSTGLLRQPGVWGKLLYPPASGVYGISLAPSDRVFLQGDTTTVRFPKHPEGVLLLFGVNGYRDPGHLVNCYLLFRVHGGSHVEWRFSGHLTRFSGKDVSLLAKVENDWAPIYAALAPAGFKNVEALRKVLREEGWDKETDTK
jgi:hypothetical protein